MLLGATQLVKVPDKLMTYITLFCFDRGYYPHFVDIYVPWVLSAFCGYRGHISISWILFVLVTLQST